MSISARSLLLSAVLLFLSGGFSHLAAQDHIVPPADLHRDLLAANEKRQASVARVQKLFENQRTIQALNQVGISSDVVKDSVSSLSTNELDHLEQHMTAAQSAEAAGGLTAMQVTLLIVAAVVASFIAIAA
jgi:hypothetical protein